MTEEWKDIPDFKDYQISSFGRLRSLKRKPWPNVPNSEVLNEFDTSLILSPRLNKGRVRYCLSKDGKPYYIFAARLVLMAFVGPCPSNHECLHGDGDRTNNRLDNLRWGTHLENLLDAERHRLKKRP